MRGNCTQNRETLPAQQGDTKSNRADLMFNQNLSPNSKVLPRTNSFVSQSSHLHVTNSPCHFDKNFRSHWKTLLCHITNYSALWWKLSWSIKILVVTSWPLLRERQKNKALCNLWKTSRCSATGRQACLVTLSIQMSSRIFSSAHLCSILANSSSNIKKCTQLSLGH